MTGGLYDVEEQPPFAMNNVTCVGGEDFILECSLVLTSYCSTEETAVVMCHGKHGL